MKRTALVAQKSLKTLAALLLKSLDWPSRATKEIGDVCTQASYYESPEQHHPT